LLKSPSRPAMPLVLWVLGCPLHFSTLTPSSAVGMHLLDYK
jgi:hypothetical protein